MEIINGEEIIIEDEEEIVEEVIVLPTLDDEGYQSFVSENSEKLALTPQDLGREASDLESEFGLLNNQIEGVTGGESIFDKVPLIGKYFGNNVEFKRTSFEGKINLLLEGYQQKIDRLEDIIEIDKETLEGTKKWVAKYQESVKDIDVEKLSPIDRVRYSQRIKTIESQLLNIEIVSKRLEEAIMIHIVMKESKTRYQGQFTTAIQNIGAGNILSDALGTLKSYETTSVVTEKGTVDRAIANSKNTLSIGQSVINSASSAANHSRLLSSTQNITLQLGNGGKKN